MPPMASAAASPRVRKELDADTRTDWPVAALQARLPQLIRAFAPIHAAVSTVATVTAPDRLTAAVPAPPAEMPMLAM